MEEIQEQTVYYIGINDTMYISYDRNKHTAHPVHSDREITISEEKLADFLAVAKMFGFKVGTL